MKSNSPFLNLHYSLGEIDTNIKMIWEFFEFSEFFEVTQS
jgi:hypothetical protein